MAETKVNGAICETEQVHHIKTPYKRELVWRNIILMVILHLSALYGLYLAITVVQFKTIMFLNFIAFFSSFGIQVFNTTSLIY